MKKLFSIGTTTFFFLVDTEHETGYVVVVDENLLKFTCLLRAWKELDPRRIARLLVRLKGRVKQVVLCSCDGNGDFQQFGADTSLTTCGDDWTLVHINTVKELAAPHLEKIEKEMHQTPAEWYAANKTHIQTALALLREKRYTDAREHCKIFGLDYEALLEEMKEGEANAKKYR